jgi:L-fuculose-phosphate aldolase
MPPYATAYSLKHCSVIPQDYYGDQILGEVKVYDPQNFNDWEKRAAHEIRHFFQEQKEHLLLIKGFGLISYDRDLSEMVKKVAILENSCRLLIINRV